MVPVRFLSCCSLCRDRHLLAADTVWINRSFFAASEFYFSRTIFSMLLFYHTLVGAFLPLFILSGNWVSAKNINFYNVRPPLDLLSALPVIMRWTITTVTDGLKIGGVLKTMGRVHRLPKSVLRERSAILWAAIITGKVVTQNVCLAVKA
ncbi:ly6/PLAUR domain-containing protein 6B isoform X5 [Numida meleagris]|uniref:ly6/PLAUR domain-containing protein 6B isoform X5 n=1 Tax=Numida meleagris TaxID=8996 RepID=UPI000B3DF1E9|nr:ly6/PLAUR domain-containing protein 6B isoform X5 [Numida meleagris]